MGISLRQQSIKGGLEKIDCQLPTYYQCGGGGVGSVNDERSLERNRKPRMKNDSYFDAPCCS